MKAILLNEAGGIDKLIYGEVGKPQLKAGEVLVKVRAIGINPVDAGARQREEMITMFVGSERPAIIGWDIAGEITEKADDIDGFDIGDSVFGFAPAGRAYAEYVAIPASAIALMPAHISYEEAAAFPIAGLTGCQPLIHIGHVKKEDKVLIHAGAGGVGHYAIQMAKSMGATVIATSSAKNKDFILSLGADQHIDYTTNKFYEKVSDVDFVLDTIGGDTLTHSISVAKVHGTVVTVKLTITDEQKELADRKNVNLSIWRVQPNGEDLKLFAGLFGNGQLRSHIAAVFPFAEMGRAHAYVETGHTAGKVVVTV